MKDHFGGMVHRVKKGGINLEKGDIMFGVICGDRFNVEDCGEKKLLDSGFSSVSLIKSL